MDEFVSIKKMSKKEKKKLASKKRVTWEFSPVTRRIESKKAYNRKRISRERCSEDAGVFLCIVI